MHPQTQEKSHKLSSYPTSYLPKYRQISVMDEYELGVRLTGGGEDLAE